MPRKAKAKTPANPIPQSELPNMPTPVKKKGAIDPEILRLRAKHRAEIQDLVRQRKSKSILTYILEKLVPRLKPEDLSALYHRINAMLPDNRTPCCASPSPDQPESAPVVSEVPAQEAAQPMKPEVEAPWVMDDPPST